MSATGTCTAWGVLLLVAAVTPAFGAQQRTLTLRGHTADSAGHPIAGAEVILQGSGTTALTDSSGAFRLAGLQPGALRLLFQKPGFQSLQVPYVIRPLDPLETDLGTVILKPESTRSVGLAGSVVNALTRQPVAGATLLIAGTVMGMSSPNGQFSLGSVVLRPGGLVTVRRIGYRPLEFELWPAESSKTLNLAIALKPVAVTLNEFIVEGSLAPLYPWWESFERHRKAGLGSFLTEARIKELPAFSGVDLLKYARGVIVSGNVWADSGRVALFGALCGPPVYLIDGVEYPARVAMNILNVWPPDEILGVEVFPTPRRVPPEYKVMGSNCGVIAIWRKK